MFICTGLKTPSLKRDGMVLNMHGNDNSCHGSHSSYDRPIKTIIDCQLKISWRKEHWEQLDICDVLTETFMIVSNNLPKMIMNVKGNI